MEVNKTKKRGIALLLKGLFYMVIIVLFLGTVLAFKIWQTVFKPNVTIMQEGYADIYVPTGSDMNNVLDLLAEKDLIRNPATLNWVSKKKNYQNNVHPGRYRLMDGMNNNELINMLRSGNQLPVNLTFINHRTIQDIASVVARQIEADSAAISELAMNIDFIETIGFDTTTIPALFIPNTYQFYWNTSAEQFYHRMKNEYERFWNKEREDKLQLLGIDRIQVSTLASIVSEETVKHEEMPVIAGVYINRLKKGMRLQADPTIKYAIGDFTVKRILTLHLEVDSPYNTYKYAGLPPGPIVVPPSQAIDAVLNAQEHAYLYFCAKEDFSGYHRFAKTLAEHNRNARLYQNALNQRRVFR